MKKLTLCIPLLLVAVGCSHHGDIRYFPAGALEAEPTSDAFRGQWYSSHLSAMGEPILSAPAAEASLRFTWLRTFNHPIAIRVGFTGKSCRLVATELSGSGGYEPGSVYRRAKRALTEQECAGLIGRLNSPQLWQPPPKTFSLDGAEWIVESSVGKYRLVSNSSPQSGPVRSLGLELIRLTGWSIPEYKIY